MAGSAAALLRKFIALLFAGLRVHGTIALKGGTAATVKVGDMQPCRIESGLTMMSIEVRHIIGAIA